MENSKNIMNCTILCVRPQICRDAPPTDYYLDSLALLFILKRNMSHLFQQMNYKGSSLRHIKIIVHEMTRVATVVC
jgi:hypothetical protein